jgi:hypothetical protein
MNTKCIGGFQVYKNLVLRIFATKAKTVEKELAIMSSWHTSEHFQCSETQVYFVKCIPQSLLLYF